MLIYHKTKLEHLDAKLKGRLKRSALPAVDVADLHAGDADHARAGVLSRMRSLSFLHSICYVHNFIMHVDLFH